MARGGKREGAGRKPGIPGINKARMLETISSSGITPLDFLLQELRDENLPHDARHAAAVAAAPYVHSKMPTAIVTPPPPSGPVSTDDQALLRQYLDGLHEEADAG